VSSRLASVATELSSSVEEVNRLAAAGLGDPETPLGAVVRARGAREGGAARGARGAPI
jgi:hypothetical protein